MTTISRDIPIEEAFVTLADDIARTDPRLGERIRELVQRLPLEGVALSAWRTMDRLNRRILAHDEEHKRTLAENSELRTIVQHLVEDVKALQKAAS